MYHFVLSLSISFDLYHRGRTMISEHRLHVFSGKNNYAREAPKDNIFQGNMALTGWLCFQDHTE